jgi:hypothetical protein
MIQKSKKYLLLLLLIGLSFGGYLYFFSSQWGVSIPKEHLWRHSFLPAETTAINIDNWIKSARIVPEKHRDQSLVFQTTFKLTDCSKIIAGELQYNYKYAAKVLINNVAYGDIDRNLITSALEKNEIRVAEYWRPRSVKLNAEFLQKVLKDGENTISLIIYNTQDFKEFKSSNKQLSFLSKGRTNKLESNLKIVRPSSYFSESTLSIFKINTNSLSVPDEPKINSSLKIIHRDSPLNQLFDEGESYRIKIERRGNTSQTFSKKSYSFKLYDAKNNSVSKSLLHLPKSKKWVLYGPYADKSLIRNALTYALYRKMGNYAPRTRFVDLVINNNYQGIYVLTEKIQISPQHLSIHPLQIDANDSSKATGGYLLEIDRSEWKGLYPPANDTSAIPISYMVKAPKKKAINSEIAKRIQSQFNAFEKHLYENDRIYNYLDLNSFIDYLLITEFTKNIDGYCLSTYLYNKDISQKTPKFYLGPIWDYNFSFGLTDYREGFNPEGYVYNSSQYIPFWWKKLLNDKTFKVALEKRYFELRKTALSNQNITNTIDSLASICNPSTELNFKKWPVLGATDFWPNYYFGKTYDDEINYLKKWIAKRLTFLDNDILGKTKKGVRYYEISIRNNKKWMKDVEAKGKERNVAIDEMISIDAKYMAKKQ